MKGLMFVFLFGIITCSVNAQDMVPVASGIKRSVTTVKNKTQKHSTIKRVNKSNSSNVSSNTAKTNSGIKRTIHSVPNLESEKYKYQKGIKRVVGVSN